MSTTPVDKPREKCRLAEILQYQCEADQAAGGAQMHCLPVPRIFRMYTLSVIALTPRGLGVLISHASSCPNRPAVEMTRFIHVDLETGAVHLPPQSRCVSCPCIWSG